MDECHLSNIINLGKTHTHTFCAMLNIVVLEWFQHVFYFLFDKILKNNLLFVLNFLQNKEIPKISIVKFQPQILKFKNLGLK
jgi:hypothetical protein